MKNKIEHIAHKRGYVVSEDGLMYNPDGKEIGKSAATGYFACSIRINSIKKNLKIHRLQAFQKYGVAIFEEGVQVRHLNGNPLDNSWDNIAIGNQSDNMMDIPKNIRIKKAQYATSFIRKYDKEEVREFHAINKSYKATMEKFNISSKGTLYHILKK